MRVTTHGKKFIGRLELLAPIKDCTREEREQVAILLRRYANEVAVAGLAGTIDLYVERD